MKDSNIDWYNSAIKHLTKKYNCKSLDSSRLDNYTEKDRGLVLLLDQYNISPTTILPELIRKCRVLHIKMIKYAN